MKFRIWITVVGPSGRPVEVRNDRTVEASSLEEVLTAVVAELPKFTLTEPVGLRVEREAE